jgi:phosphatidylglycerophosphatase A
MVRAADLETASTPIPVAVSPRRTRWAWLIATAFGLGRLRPGPGTWTSAVIVLGWWAAAAIVPEAWRWPLAVVVALVLTFAGIQASAVAARESGRRDPAEVTVDEAAGQMLALIALPLSWQYFLAGFILFRGFDIMKPPPLRWLERLPAGAGIMFDDVGAGLYALAGAHLLLHFRLLG